MYPMVPNMLLVLPVPAEPFLVYYEVMVKQFALWNKKESEKLRQRNPISLPDSHSATCLPFQ